MLSRARWDDGVSGGWVYVCRAVVAHKRTRMPGRSCFTSNVSSAKVGP